MKDEIAHGYEFFKGIEHEIKPKAEALLIKGIESNHFVFISEFNCRPMFESILISTAKQKNMSVIIAKSDEKIEQLRYRKRYDHIYNVETFNSSSNVERPQNILVSDNINIQALSGTDADKIVGGFRRFQKN